MIGTEVPIMLIKVLENIFCGVHFQSKLVGLRPAAALKRAASQMFPVVVSKVFSLGYFQPANVPF